jgi:hypothetical protein
MRLSAHMRTYRSDEDAYSLYGTDSALDQTYITIFLMILQKEIQGDDDSEITKRNKDQ